MVETENESKGRGWRIKDVNKLDINSSTARKGLKEEEGKTIDESPRGQKNGNVDGGRGEKTT